MRTMNDWNRLLLDTEASARAEGLRDDERQDLVQEALLRLLPDLDARPAAGLIRIVLRRLAIDGWRRRRETVLEDDVAGQDFDPHHELERAELRKQIRRCVDRLPEAQRQVVLWRLEEGVSFKEIARRQGVTLNTALGRMHLACKKLRYDLETWRG
ncbi:MAG: hypothetical protein CMJ83_16255 [Planctomycetes bacterium]|nr:hypothetical protein [Planctomycetota bacterium]